MSLQTIVRGVRKSFLLVVVLTTLFAGFRVPMNAQDAMDRKIKNRVEPIYPEIARKMNLTGVVRLELVVAPNGTVKDTKVIGGNPILVNAAIDAVKKWRFEAATTESTVLKEFKFEGNN